MKTQKNAPESQTLNTNQETKTITVGNYNEVNPYTGEPRLFKHIHDRTKVQFSDDSPSMTHQSHADSCDINKIIKQYDRTGVLPPAAHPPQYGDVSELGGDLTEQINKSLHTQNEYQQYLLSEQQKTEELNKKTNEVNDLETSPKDEPKPE